MINPRLILLSICFSAFAIRTQAQVPGCMDRNATNYSSAATVNDGSCTYAVTNYTPALVSRLSNTMGESSGLIFWNNYLWTHNDSGNEPHLYKMDSATGNVLQTITISNFVNKDWEAITQNDTHIFIGDFGNNSGNRQDLSILKISKADILASTTDSVAATSILFSYPEQTSFAVNNNTEFDCEAMFFANDSLHLFTKDWANQQSRHYVVPALEGTYDAQLRESYNINGLITDASYDATHNRTMLLGYKNIGGGFYTCFAWLLTDFNGYQFFSGNKRRIELGNALERGQTEGITFIQDGTGYISSESISNATLGINEPAKLHRFDISAYLPDYSDEPPASVTDLKDAQKPLLIYPNPVKDVLYIESQKEQPYEMRSLKGEVVQKGILKAIINRISIGSLAQGIYTVYLVDDKSSGKFVVE